LENQQGPIIRGISPVKCVAGMKRMKLSRTRGLYQVNAEALLIGEDLVVSIWGGTRPHVGAVALAIPRPSLKNQRTTSATSSVFTRLGHKEDDIVKRFSEQVSAGVNRVVVVTAGIHWDGIGPEGVEIVRSLCDEISKSLIGRVSERKR
jgi:gallate decarboxylase subunit D